MNAQAFLKDKKIKAYQMHLYFRLCFDPENKSDTPLQTHHWHKLEASEEVCQRALEEAKKQFP